MGVVKLFNNDLEMYPSNLSNPNPKNFEVLDLYQSKQGLKNPIMVKIKYPDATNFEGVKVLIFRTQRYYLKCYYNNIDPHFFNASDLVCRLRPDQWELGKQILNLVR